MVRPEGGVAVEEHGDAEGIRNRPAHVSRERFRPLPGKSAEGNEREHVDGADSRMDSSMDSQVDALERAVHEAEGSLEHRIRLGHGRQDGPVVGRIEVSVEEPDSAAFGEGPRNVGDRGVRPPLADVRNQLQDAHGYGKHYHSRSDGSIFYEEIVPRTSVPRTEILDRRETDFKTDELVVGSDDNRETPPKSLDLLRQGDELYSQGLYHQAIHLWTRILFLDRGNREARLRIERAKETVAELERRLDVEVAEAQGLFDAGEIEAARERIRSVLATDGSRGEAKELAAAIESLDRRKDATQEVPRDADALGAPVSAPARGVVIKVPKVARAASPGVGRPATSRFKMAAFLLGAGLLFALSAFFLSENWDALVSDGAFGQPAGLGAGVQGERLPASVPDLSQLRYYNGERLFAQGRYREALSELRRVDRDSTVTAEARSLILRIEDRLLRGVTVPEAEMR